MKLRLLALSLLAFSFNTAALGQAGTDQPMSFFITSVGVGDGANLGGLAGADAHCMALATDVGRGDATWRAYLSTQGANAVNARDRIGNGPWYGAAGHMVARDLAHLHGDTIELARLGNGLNQFHARDENADFVDGIMSRAMNNVASVHDILTGSMSDGRAFTDGGEHTCSNWTSNAEGEGSAQVGHHDRMGFDNTSWNSTHGTGGCSQASLVPSGGAGLFYCFAVE
jgi:hypothetical protein